LESKAKTKAKVLWALEHLSLRGKAESWGCSAWRREGCGEALWHPSST